VVLPLIKGGVTERVVGSVLQRSVKIDKLNLTKVVIRRMSVKSYDDGRILKKNPLITTYEGSLFVKIGFAILSHNEPEQLLRLVTTLNTMFGAPPLVCHHDFNKCSLNEARFPPNVRFVHPHIITRWGNITMALAALRAFSLLREHDQPDWFVLLSGSDYPVRSADEIVADLSNTNYDAFLDSREILYRALPPGQMADCGFGRPSWIPLAYDRYCAFRLFWWPYPSKEKLLSGKFPFRRKHVFIRNPSMLRWLSPNRPSRIYGGDFWIQANHKAIDRLLDDPSMPRLVQFYRKRKIPEESLFHTSLCNQPDLRICKDHKRYVDWARGGANPKWLEVSDLPRIFSSGAHFARKFRPDGLAQELIDRTVLGLSNYATMR
jgi:hypothetical protein